MLVAVRIFVILSVGINPLIWPQGPDKRDIKLGLMKIFNFALKMARSRTVLNSLLRIREMPMRMAISILRRQSLLKEKMKRCPVFFAPWRWMNTKRGPCRHNQVEVHEQILPWIQALIQHSAWLLLDSFRISIVDVWTVVMCWLESVPAKNIVNIFGISNDTVTRIFQMLRTLISDNLRGINQRQST